MSLNVWLLQHQQMCDHVDGGNSGRDKEGDEWDIEPVLSFSGEQAFIH